LREEWKEAIIVPTSEKIDKAECRRYRDMPVLSATYTILSTIPPSMLIPYAGEIIGNRQCGFQSNKSSTGHPALVKELRKMSIKLRSASALCRLKYDSVRTESE
jgi:hypothetical protein